MIEAVFKGESKLLEYGKTYKLKEEVKRDWKVIVVDSENEKVWKTYFGITDFLLEWDVKGVYIDE